MVMDGNDVLLRGSIGLSLAAWTAAECTRLTSGAAAGRERAARRLWTAGAVLAALHVAAGFHFRHGWSHAAAYAETARQTEELLGFRVGGGLFVNYAFLVVWAADAFWWWWKPATFPSRPRVVDAAVRLFLLFMFVNGTIVFAHRTARVLGVLAMLALGVAWYVGRDRVRWGRGIGE
jgi:hypothetical protein